VYTRFTRVWTLGSPGFVDTGSWTQGYLGADTRFTTRFTGVWFVDTGSWTQGLPGCGH
jgi:hypothetical protein